jgi:hypothetical protein
MNPKDLKKGMILFNPKTSVYVQIKEITRSPDGFAQWIVCSGNCASFGDSQTMKFKNWKKWWAGEINGE